MKKRAMKLNKFNLTLLGSIFLAGCNGGHQVVQQENTEHEISESNEKLSRGTALQYITIGAGDEQQDVAYNNVRIGYGYNVQTGEIFAGSQPLLSTLAYPSDPDKESSNMIRPIDACPEGFIEQDFGADFGNITFSDIDSVWEANAGMGVNYGLAKLKVAAAYNNQKTTNTGKMSHNKYFGGKASCWIRSFADVGSPKSPYDATTTSHFADALKASNYDIRELIGKIRSMEAAGESAQNVGLINQFYKTFGTHMVSAVEVSEFATMRLSLNEVTQDSTNKWGLSAAANFAYPGVTVDAGMSHAHADKISTKNWSVTTEKKVFPMGSVMEGSIGKMIDYVSAALGGGIINFNDLKHDSGTATKIDKPTLPNVEAEAKSEYQANQAFKNLDKNYENANKAISLLSGSVNIENAAKAKDSLLNLSAAKTIVESSIGALSTEKSQRYLGVIAPFFRALSDYKVMNSLANYIADDTKPENKTDLETQLANLKKGANGATEARAAQVEKVKKFLAAYPSLDAYLKALRSYNDNTYGGQQLIDDAADKEKNDRIKYSTDKAWLEHLDGIYQEDQETQRAGMRLRIKLATNYNDILVYKKMITVNGKLKSNAMPQLLSERPILTGDDNETLYGNRPVTDFNIVPWSVIFPELLGSFALDNSTDIAILNITDEINLYMRKYRYLQVAISVTNDAKLSAALQNESGNYTKLSTLYNKLNTMYGGSISPQVTFNNGTYDMESAGQRSSLYLMVKTLAGLESTNATSSFSENSQAPLPKWNKIVNLLMSRDLIGQYAAIPAIQPKEDNPENKYYLFSGENEQELPTYSSSQWTGWTDRVKRIILQIVWNELYNDKGTKGNTQPIPRGVVSYPTINTAQKNAFVINSTDSYGNAYSPSAVDKATGRGLSSLANYLNASSSTPYHALGYLPIVTSVSELTNTSDNNTIIDRIGLLSSTGRIIGSDVDVLNGGNRWVMNKNTTTYKLNITTGDINHLYPVAISGENFEDSYPVVEFNWILENRPEAVGVTEKGIYIGFRQSLVNAFTSCKMKFANWEKAAWKSPVIQHCDGKGYISDSVLKSKGVWYADHKGEDNGIMGVSRDKDYHMYGIKFNNPFNGPYLSKHEWVNWNRDGKTNGTANGDGWWQFTPSEETAEEEIGFSATSQYWRDGEDRKKMSANYGDWTLDGNRATTHNKLALIPVKADTVWDMNGNYQQNLVLPTFIH